MWSSNISRSKSILFFLIADWFYTSCAKLPFTTDSVEISQLVPKDLSIEEFQKQKERKKLSTVFGNNVKISIWESCLILLDHITSYSLSGTYSKPCWSTGARWKAQPCSLMCPQSGIKHKAAITVHSQCSLLLIAALCFIPFCGQINEHGQRNLPDFLLFPLHFHDIFLLLMTFCSNFSVLRCSLLRECHTQIEGHVETHRTENLFIYLFFWSSCGEEEITLYIQNVNHSYLLTLIWMHNVTRSDKTRNKGHLWRFQFLISSEPLQTKLWNDTRIMFVA